MWRARITIETNSRWLCAPNYCVIWFELLFPTRCQLLLNYMYGVHEKHAFMLLLSNRLIGDTYFQLLPHSIRTKWEKKTSTCAGSENGVTNFTEFLRFKITNLFMRDWRFPRKLMLIAKKRNNSKQFSSLIPSILFQQMTIGWSNHFNDNQIP